MAPTRAAGKEVRVNSAKPPAIHVAVWEGASGNALLLAADRPFIDLGPGRVPGRGGQFNVSDWQDGESLHRLQGI